MLFANCPIGKGQLDDYPSIAERVGSAPRSNAQRSELESTPWSASSRFAIVHPKRPARRRSARTPCPRALDDTSNCAPYLTSAVRRCPPLQRAFARLSNTWGASEVKSVVLMISGEMISNEIRRLRVFQYGRPNAHQRGCLHAVPIDDDLMPLLGFPLGFLATAGMVVRQPSTPAGAK